MSNGQFITQIPSAAKPIIILAGADGSGKSTLAANLCNGMDLAYRHFGPLPHVKGGLPRMYVEAMLPALLGYQGVLMDRSWLCERPYGVTFRNGADRLTTGRRRMLERIAMCGHAIIIHCDPGSTAMTKSFADRSASEYLKKADQVLQVASLYDFEVQSLTSLPHLKYDYTQENAMAQTYQSVHAYFNRGVSVLHKHPGITAGSLSSADIVLVGDEYAEHKDNDTYTQFPFVSFSNTGCSHWFAEQLDKIDMPESRLLWVNQDQLSPFTDIGMEVFAPRYDGTTRTVFALGAKAGKNLDDLGIPHLKVQHPQHLARFDRKAAGLYLNQTLRLHTL